ncbi:hypothetical protein PV396_09180 [Streptomyces sp. ME02-8801-2C]|uniref:hypothetical protein n=1 Tax=Streptomyces sp. ME02-8801-2C TaxID=3028680 RepID=UPI0029ADE81E|nr:hypothetical protein [Streptomyces sp. ME02-8801-2C]MDX3452110.1 hypothetical protein [Streptomyces sp. ME02-8801-2C]
MYFFGAISHSQVVIGSGTVTQTQVNQFKETYIRGTARTPAEPECASPTGTPAPPRRSAAQPVAATLPQQPCISAEVFCRVYLPLTLAELRAQVAALGLSRKARKALLQDIDDLSRAAHSIPVDMTAINAGLSRVEKILSPTPQVDVPPPGTGQSTPKRGEDS